MPESAYKYALRTRGVEQNASVQRQIHTIGWRRWYWPSFSVKWSLMDHPPRFSLLHILTEYNDAQEARKSHWQILFSTITREGKEDKRMWERAFLHLTRWSKSLGGELILAYNQRILIAAKAKAKATPQINDMIGWITKNSRNARGWRSLVQFFDVVCHTTMWNFHIWTRRRCSKLSLSLFLCMKTILIKQAKKTRSATWRK